MSAADLPAVAVVGAGRVGRAIATALRARGAEVSGPFGRSDAVPPAPLVILAVPDDAVAAVAAAIPAYDGLTLVHTSGAHGLDVLGDRERRVAAHPIQTFTGGTDDATRLDGITWGITADPSAEATAHALVSALGGRAAHIDPGDRARYHAALANAANHLVTLLAQSADWLGAAGVADPAAALEPLVRAAVGNALALGDAALTGPVSRGDVGTVAAHLAALAGSGDPPEAVAAYRAMALLTAVRAHTAGRIDAATLAALRAALAPVP